MEKYKKYTQRFKDLIKEFDEEVLLIRHEYTNFNSQICYEYPVESYPKLQGWFMKCESIIGLTFGVDSLQTKRFLALRDNLKESNIYNKANQIRGLIEADLNDIENGFILGQEFIIANEVFDSVLEEAKFFIFEQKNKDIGAILLRIVLEDAIKRIAKKEKLDIEDKKISTLNEELKTKNYFIQTVWRQNQAWLDIGNKAAHGEFEEYNLVQVENFYNGLVGFLSINFS